LEANKRWEELASGNLKIKIGGHLCSSVCRSCHCTC
jgi:hypothetical protein